MTNKETIRKIFFVLFLTYNYSEAAIYNCDIVGETSIVYNTIKKEVEASSSKNEKPNKKNSLTFVENKKDFQIKGNGGQSSGIRISPTQFLEEAQSGNKILWTLLVGSKDTPTFLFSNKAYDLFGPASFSAMYKCE